jgi:type IV pilus assembly protein PilC
MAGEKSGSLPEVLNRLIYIIEHEENVKKNIKSALQYPTIVVIVLVLAFIVLLTFVMPKFAAIFMKANIELPLPTKIIMKIYDIFTIYWYMMLSSVLTTITLIKLYIKTEQGLFVKDTILLKLPIFGPLFLKSAMSRFASIFATLQASGVPVVDSIAMLSATIGNAAISRSFVQISKLIEQGQGISGPLEKAKYFPPMVVDMVAIGEESGDLESMMLDVTEHYDAEVEYALKGLSSAIEPILIVVLTAMVGFFALAIFMPIWDMSKVSMK